MQTSPPRGFTRHVISTARFWGSRGEVKRGREGRSEAVVFTSRHLRRRPCQPHTRVQYKIYIWFTQWISARLRQPTQWSREDLSFRLTMLHIPLWYNDCEAESRVERSKNEAGWVDGFLVGMMRLAHVDWRHRRHHTTKISLIEPWIEEIQISREISLVRTWKAHRGRQGAGGVRENVSFSFQSHNKKIQLMTKELKKGVCYKTKGGDLLVGSMSNGWRTLLNYITTSGGTLKSCYK